MRCIECEEIELARVRDQRPAQTLPIPYQALDGFPAGTHARRELTRRRLLQWGVAGARVGLRRQGARLRADLGVRRRGGRRPGQEVRRAALPGGRQRRPQRRPAQRRRRLRGVRRPRAPYHPSRPGRQRRRRASAPSRCPGRRATRWRSPTRPSPAPTTTAARAGFDTLFGDGTGGPGSDLAIMPAVDAKKYTLSHFDNSDIWFEASADLNNKTGWLGRWIDRNGSTRTTRCRRSRSTPRSRRRSARRKSPVCAINSLPMTGFKPTGSLPPPGGPTQPRAVLERRGAQAHEVSGRRGQRRTSPARAAPTG